MFGEYDPYDNFAASPNMLPKKMWLPDKAVPNFEGDIYVWGKVADRGELARILKIVEKFTKDAWMQHEGVGADKAARAKSADRVKKHYAVLDYRSQHTVNVQFIDPRDVYALRKAYGSTVSAALGFLLSAKLDQWDDEDEYRMEEDEAFKG